MLTKSVVGGEKKEGENVVLVSSHQGLADPKSTKSFGVHPLFPQTHTQISLRCQNCGLPIKPTRKWRKFCNAYCRVTYYRHRQKERLRASSNAYTPLTDEEYDLIARRYL